MRWCAAIGEDASEAGGIFQTKELTVNNCRLKFGLIELCAGTSSLFSDIIFASWHFPLQSESGFILLMQSTLAMKSWFNLNPANDTALLNDCMNTISSKIGI